MQPNLQAGEDFMLLLERQVRNMQEKADALTVAFRESASTVRSPDGSVTVTVEANGSLSNIEFGNRACSLGAAKLTALVMQTVREAQRQTANNVAESFVEVNGEDQSAELIRSFLPPVEDVPAPENPVQDKWAPEAHHEEPPAPPVATRRPTPPPPPPAPPARRPRPAAEDEDESSPW